MQIQGTCRATMRHFFQKQTNKNDISGLAQMVPLTRVCQPEVSLCLAWRESLRVCLVLSSERLQLQMVLWSAGSSRYFPILTAGGRVKSSSSTSSPSSPVFVSLSVVLSLFPPPLLWVQLPTSEHHQVTLAVSPLIFLHSFIVSTLSHSGPPSSLPSLYSPTPRSDLPLWGLCVTDECYQSARGRWDDEWVSKRASECVWAFVRKWLLPRCFYFGSCVCVCAPPSPFACVHQRHHRHRCTYFLLSCRESASYNTKQVRLRRYYSSGDKIILSFLSRRLSHRFVGTSLLTSDATDRGEFTH